MNATIFNIQKFSVNDGPGIRTTVFLKGCPLSCAWCHNPESLSSDPELIFFKKKCIGCGRCVNACGYGALWPDGAGVGIERSKCVRCGACVEVCPTEALQMAGKEMGLEDILREIEQDAIFYQQSRGGVTFSGGEPMAQIDALETLLARCKLKGLHTAVDTSGHASWKDFERILPYTDLFLFDLKHLEDGIHLEFTGVTNRVILENLRQLSESGAVIGLRVPVIPGVNDSEAYAEQLGKRLSSLRIETVYLLPYHGIAKGKYERLGRSYGLESLTAPSEEKMQRYKAILDNYGLKVRIGG